MKRYKINYDAIASGVATLEKVFGGEQTDRLVEEIAGELVKVSWRFKEWSTMQFHIYDNLAWEICASFSNEDGFEIDYIKIGASNAGEVVAFDLTSLSGAWRAVEWNSFFLSDDECKAVEECANELYALNNK